MKLVLGRPYLNLDSCFSISEFEALIDSIILGIARSHSHKVIFRSGGLTYPGDHRAIDVADQLKKLQIDPMNKEFQMFQKHGLRATEQFSYLKYKYTTSHLNEGILLRSADVAQGPHLGEKDFSSRLNNSFANKWSAEATAETKAAENFRPFLDWVYAQKAFSEVGRVVLFLSDRGESTMRHKDHGLPKSEDEFVWINALLHLGKPKKFFVYDPGANQKVFLENQFCFFDNSNFHGSDPSEYDTFSIRIDGKFSSQTRKSLGLPVRTL